MHSRTRKYQHAFSDPKQASIVYNKRVKTQATTTTKAAADRRPAAEIGGVTGVPVVVAVVEVVVVEVVVVVVVVVVFVKLPGGGMAGVGNGDDVFPDGIGGEGGGRGGK